MRGDVIVTLVADEELGSIGTEEMLERIQADAAIVAEPTELRVAIAHRGFVGFEIETTGVAAHGSRPDLGVDAIARWDRSLSRSRNSINGCSEELVIRSSDRPRFTRH